MPVLIIVLTVAPRTDAVEFSLPEFDRGTVLVWKIEGPEYERSFVARLASFRPDRFFEWENETGQGTVFMPERAIAEARVYEMSSLFTQGRDRRTRNETALWLSLRVFTELKEKKTVRWDLNGVASRLSFIEERTLPVEVNRIIVELPVILAADGRNGEWSFLNQPENPLMVRYEVLNYRQTLSSITTTGSSDYFRWILDK